MKILQVVALWVLVIAVPLAYAGKSPVMTAQGEATAAPAPQKDPVAAAAPKTATSDESASNRQSHKDYGGMAIPECTGCHKGEGIGPTHGAYWMTEHRVVASRKQANCADCHDQSFCLDCHKGGGIDTDLKTSNYKSSTIPNSHRTDFREIHPLKVLDNPQTCYRCHDNRYCQECHAKFKGEDLRVQSHRRSWSDLKTTDVGPMHSTFNTSQCQTCHPGGLLPKHEWSADHAREARRNLQACQTCHGDGDVCMTCHSARRGLMVNPHPRDWGRVRDKYRSKSNGRSCIKCHDNY